MAGMYVKCLVPKTCSENAPAAPIFWDWVTCPLPSLQASHASGSLTSFCFSGMNCGKTPLLQCRDWSLIVGIGIWVKKCWDCSDEIINIWVWVCEFWAWLCREADLSTAPVEGSHSVFLWFSFPACVAPSQMPCLFMLGSIIAHIESDQIDQWECR